MGPVFQFNEDLIGSPLMRRVTSPRRLRSLASFRENWILCTTSYSKEPLAISTRLNTIGWIVPKLASSRWTSTRVTPFSPCIHGSIVKVGEAELFSALEEILRPSVGLYQTGSCCCPPEFARNYSTNPE